MLKSKRGIAIESAIVFIVVIFSFCSLITTYTLMGHYKVTGDNFEINNRAELDQIGEDFIYNLEDYARKLNGENPPQNPELPQKDGYVTKIDKSTEPSPETEDYVTYYVLEVYRNEILKLSVKATFDEHGNVKLIYWK